MKDKHKSVLAVGAHPDDVEFMCAGLLALLRDKGFEIHVATLSSGDCGSVTEARERIAKIRSAEAEAACRLLGADYHPLGFSDFCIFNDDDSNRRVTALIREMCPAVVVTHPPQDYLSDHEATSTLVRNACFYGTVRNYSTSAWTSLGPGDSIPHLYYAHPMEGMDLFGNAIPPHLYVDISSTIPLKADMLACHQSQREWLQAQHRMDEYVESMKRWSVNLGQQASALSGRSIEFAEAYRQHRGHAYPKTDLLGELLGQLVIPAREVEKTLNWLPGVSA